MLSSYAQERQTCSKTLAACEIVLLCVYVCEVWKNTPPVLTGTGGFESVFLYGAQWLLRSHTLSNKELFRHEPASLGEQETLSFSAGSSTHRAFTATGLLIDWLCRLEMTLLSLHWLVHFHSITCSSNYFCSIQYLRYAQYANFLYVLMSWH